MAARSGQGRLSGQATALCSEPASRERPGAPHSEKDGGRGVFRLAEDLLRSNGEVFRECLLLSNGGSHAEDFKSFLQEEGAHLKLFPSGICLNVLQDSCRLVSHSTAGASEGWFLCVPGAHMFLSVLTSPSS